MLEPLGSSFDHDQVVESARKAISDTADRLSRFAYIVGELAEMRADDRAAAMRAACADELSTMNRQFQDLARALSQKPAERAKAHFQDTGTKEPRQQEERRTERLQEEAEADAAAAR